MTHPAPAALAADDDQPPVTFTDVLAVVDELAIASSPIPRSPIVRIPLITLLRAELTPSLGSTSAGRGGGSRIPIDAGALALWEDITGRIEAMHENVEGAAPTTGSYEQILITWAREMSAFDTSTGLSQDAIRYALHRVTRIRDLIRDHFDPPKTGDIPGVACYECAATTAIRIVDGEEQQMPALGWSHRPDTGVTVTCRACDAHWDQQALRHREEDIWAERLQKLDQELTDDEWKRLRRDLRENPAPITNTIWKAHP